MARQYCFRLLWLGLIVQTVLGTLVHAHPGSSIAVDEQGIVWFTDTGRGIWKVTPDGKPELISPSSPHWMGVDMTGAFAKSREKFGRWFERLTSEGSKPTIIASTEFPVAMGRDGSLFYANTIQRPTKIIRRTAGGKETTLVELADEAPTAKEVGRASYVTGMTVAPDGSLYLVEAAAQAEFVVIRRVAMDGTVTTLARDFVPTDIKFEPKPAIAPSAVPKGLTPPMIARNYCRGLTIAEDGTIYIAANAVRAVLEIKPKQADSEQKVRVVLQADAPWGVTDVTLWKGEVYALEYDHTGEDREFWFPRVRIVGKDGNIRTLVSLTKE